MMLKRIRHTARLMASALAARRIMWLAEPAQAGGYNVTLERVVVRAHAISASRGIRKMASTRMTATRALSMGAALAAGLLFATAAQARYTAIDGFDDDDGNPITQFYYFGGYCDTTSIGGNGSQIGEECFNTYTLPYNVTIGGKTTNKLSVRDDGKLQFVTGERTAPDGITAGVVPDEFLPDGKKNPDYDTLYPKYLDFMRNRFVFDPVNGEIDTGFGGLVSQDHAFILEVETVSGFSLPSRYPTANYSILGPRIKFEWFTCNSSNPAVDDCLKNKANVTLTPFGGGFDVAFGGVSKYILPAKISPLPSVPEPGTWTLLILGFSGIGATLRARRRTQLQGA